VVGADLQSPEVAFVVIVSRVEMYVTD